MSYIVSFKERIAISKLCMWLYNNRLICISCRPPRLITHGCHGLHSRLPFIYSTYYYDSIIICLINNNWSATPKEAAAFSFLHHRLASLQVTHQWLGGTNLTLVLLTCIPYKTVQFVYCYFSQEKLCECL